MKFEVIYTFYHLFRDLGAVKCLYPSGKTYLKLVLSALGPERVCAADEEQLLGREVRDDADVVLALGLKRERGKQDSGQKVWFLFVAGISNLTGFLLFQESARLYPKGLLKCENIFPSESSPSLSEGRQQPAAAAGPFTHAAAAALGRILIKVPRATAAATRAAPGTA